MLNNNLNINEVYKKLLIIMSKKILLILLQLFGYYGELFIEIRQRQCRVNTQLPNK